MNTDNGTTTALATREPTAVQAFGNSEQFDTAQRIGKALAASTLVPNDYQSNLPNVLVAMELANRIGASVFAVMQNMDVIHGRPAFRSTFLIATVNASGKFTPLRYRFQGEPGSDDWGCRAWAKDIETGEECEGTLITIGLAKKEGWYNNKGSKWQTMPEQMLRYRSAAFWQRVYCPELSLGMHTVEEMRDVSAQPHSSGAEDLNASLGIEPETIEAEVVSDGEATEQQVGRLRDARNTARGFDDVLTADDEEAIAAALKSKDADDVQQWYVELQKRLVNAMDE